MTLAPERIDALALEGLNVIAAARGDTGYEYDITGYRRIPRKDTPPGAFQTWSPGPAASAHVAPHPECAGDGAYQIRLGGFQRGSLYQPDEVGRLLRDHCVAHCDGPGNGKYESAMIARKYGLHLVLEAFAWGLDLPLTKAQLAAYEPQWEAKVLYMRECCKRLGDAVGLDLVDDPDNIIIALAGLDVQPLDLFLKHARDNYDEVNQDFERECGYPLPLEAGPDTPKQTARRIRFWEYLRRRYSELAFAQNKILRRHFRSSIVGNLEFDTEPDYLLWGQAYDMPGFNMRTALFDDEIGYRYWVGYGTRLSADLTHRAPMISVRTNQVAAGPRMIPIRETTRYWYGDAIRNGAGGFYLWIKDFPGDRHDPNGYFGPCMANPDPSTRPAERWQNHLEAARLLGQTRVFQPPVPGVGILVSIPSCASGAWPDVFSAYIETARARILARFISTVELRSSDGALEDVRLLLVPHAPFEHLAVIRRLRSAVENGLTMVVGSAGSFAWDEDGEVNREGRELLGIESIAPRQAVEPVQVTQGGREFPLTHYRAGFSLSPLRGATVCARFPDDAPAAIENRLGAGRVITMGSPLFDIYAAGLRDLSMEDTGRYDLLRYWHAASGAPDHSWVFDVNIENIADVTGPIDPPLRPPDPSVEFAPFLYVHGGEAVPPTC